MGKVKDHILMHFTFMVYALVSLSEKMASRYEIFSPGFTVSFFSVMFTVALYAFLWQKVLKRFPLVIAYSTKGISIVWVMLLAVSLLGESISLNNIIGALVIVLGIYFISVK